MLDPMHIEVNVAKALFKHIYGELDNKKVQKDCKVAKVHKSAWLIERRNGEVETPIAGWVLPERILKSMNQTFMNTRFPTYYGAKIKNSVKTAGAKQPSGLKSHDYHKMMHHMLPIALRSAGASAIRKDLCTLINEISTVFR